MDLLVSRDRATSLTQLQHKLFEKNMSTVILFEGPGGMAMSHIINQIVAIFEPRNVTYNTISKLPENYIQYCFTHIAPRGRISIFDRGWYSGALKLEDDDTVKMNFIREFERYLHNNDVNLVKIFLNIDEDTLEKHKDSYPVNIDDENSVFNDGNDVKDFSKHKDSVADALKLTNSEFAPWDIINVGDFKSTVVKISDFLEMRLSNILRTPRKHETFQILEAYVNPRDNVDFSKSLSKDDYKEKLDKYQRKLAELQIKLAKSGRSMTLVFEGWDAAGKGGIIKRITQALNPRGYKTFPTAAPDEVEKSHTFLWRFAVHTPPDGCIAIFDRSWYGRMMVEPIEGFCTEQEYSRAAGEINLFEAMLQHSGSIVMKFWIDITKEEQLERFNDRANDPLRQWKLTDEDWRNREKWDTYEKYVDSMIMQTNTSFAPWYCIEAVDKRYARIKVLKTIVDKLKDELKD